MGIIRVCNTPRGRTETILSMLRRSVRVWVKEERVTLSYVLEVTIDTGKWYLL
jgi:hypothetical protein